jgi:dCMP deaminase
VPRLPLHGFYMKIAQDAAQLSYCERKKVGCILVKDGNVVSFAYNGTVRGSENVCENELGDTKKEVLHSELNAIAKIAKSNMSSENAIMYVTLSPCIDCSKLIIQSGIKEVYYMELYRDPTGVQFLEDSGVKCYQIPD